MFLMLGINEDRKDLDFSQMMICDACGAYGRYQLFMTFTVLSLFFIPCLKWNRRYYVQTSCCSRLYELDREIGAAIARGEQVEIRPEYLHEIPGRNYTGRRCMNCGYTTQEDFEFCPKCGKRF